MGLVVSMLLLTIGAVLYFAVSATAEGFDVQVVGVILMVVGVLGAIMSIVFWASWGGFPARRGGVVTTRQIDTTERTGL
jgi:hypothetical protein